MVVVLVLAVTGCSSVQSRVTESGKILVVQPNSYECPKNDRIICKAAVNVPKPKLWPMEQGTYVADYFKAQKAQLKESGADLALCYEGRRQPESVTGASLDFLLNIGINVMAGRAGANASTASKAAIYSGSTVASASAKTSGEQAIKVEQGPPGSKLYLRASFPDGKNEYLACPSVAAEDPLLCLHTVAQALVAGSEKAR